MNNLGQEYHQSQVENTLDQSMCQCKRYDKILVLSLAVVTKNRQKFKSYIYIFIYTIMRNGTTIHKLRFD